MYRHLLLAAAFAATASAQQNSPPAHHSPEQVFQFLDKDNNGALSPAEFGVLKDKMPSLRDRPDGIAAMFKRLDKDGNGSLSLDEYKALTNHGARGSGTSSTPATTAEPTASDPSPAKHSKKRGARMAR